LLHRRQQDTLKVSNQHPLAKKKKESRANSHHPTPNRTRNFLLMQPRKETSSLAGAHHVPWVLVYLSTLGYYIGQIENRFQAGLLK
jgi:hypothetical protein